MGTWKYVRVVSINSWRCSIPRLPSVNAANLYVFRYKKAPPDGEAYLYMADRTGLEPATSGVTGRRSNQLNYHS